jgi:predicted DNA-binding protein
MTKSRVSTYLWLESFERLKAISDATGKPMIALMDEAIELLAQKYPRKDDEHGEVSTTGGQ